MFNIDRVFLDVFYFKNHKRMKNLANPFGSYIMTSVSVYAFYLLGFSDIYPDLTLEVGCFLLVTSGCSFFLMIAYWGIAKNAINLVMIDDLKREKRIFLAIFLGFVLEFAYSDSVPLMDLLVGAVFDYREFGIPTFHVLLIGVNFYYAIRWCSLYFVTKHRAYLLMLLGCLVLGLLIINRGAIIILLIAFIFVYFNNKLSVKKVIKTVVLAIFVVWIFGFIGNLRFLSQEIFHEDPILRIGSASSSFSKSGLPNEFFWVYLYATSPMANFQLTVNTVPVSWNYLSQGLVLNFIPDFISKRIIDTKTENLPNAELITPELTVSTAFAPAFATMGWLGPYLIYAYFVVYTLTLAAITKRSQHHQAIMALCIDPAETAQVRLLMRKPQQAFSFPAPGAGVGGCKNQSSHQ